MGIEGSYSRLNFWYKLLFLNVIGASLQDIEFSPLSNGLYEIGFWDPTLILVWNEYNIKVFMFPISLANTKYELKGSKLQADLNLLFPVLTPHKYALCIFFFCLAELSIFY